MKNAALLASVLSVVIVVPAWSQKADPDSVPVRDFQSRVKDYVRLRKRIEATMPALKPTASPERIVHHEHELAERIRTARRDVVPGNVFTPDIATEFHRLIALAMQGADATLIRQSLKHAEPVKLRLSIGEIYPAGVPLQSTPPTLLMALPPLPQEVDYRIVDSALVLRDARANLIVDFLPNAMP